MTDYRNPNYRDFNEPYHTNFSASDLKESAPAWAVLLAIVVAVGVIFYVFGGRDLQTQMMQPNRTLPPAASNNMTPAPVPALPSPNTPGAPSR